MGQTWDGGDIAFTTEMWKEVYRTLKPGAYLLAFSAARNYHRMAVAIEDSGFEIRDQIMWIYGSGFPKSHNIGKQIDKKLGNTRQVVGKNPNHRTTDDLYKFGTHKQDGMITKGDSEWEGWGTALKPAHEPIVMARKPIDGPVVDNILEHRTGAINIDESRVELSVDDKLQEGLTGRDGRKLDTTDTQGEWGFKALDREPGLGRFPANVIHDGSEEVINEFKKFGEDKGAKAPVKIEQGDFGFYDHKYNKRGDDGESFKGDTGTAARFFYCAKASKKEKGDTKHPTVKPVALMRYLVKLITPKKGIVLDPFAGTGTTGEACILENKKYYLIEAEPSYFKDIETRLNRYGGLGI